MSKKILDLLYKVPTIAGKDVGKKEKDWFKEGLTEARATLKREGCILAADRKFIEEVIDLHDNFGKDVEQIMFSLGMFYEEPENE